MPVAPSDRPAKATCCARDRSTAGAEYLSSRCRATTDLETTCRSSRCSLRKSSRAPTAPASSNCELHSVCFASWEIAPTAYSRMFSLCMKMRATSRIAGAASSLAMSSRFVSALAKLSKAPRASLATFRSSWLRHCLSASTTSCTTPASPSCTRTSASVARLPKKPHASLSTVTFSLNVRIAWSTIGMKPSATISSRAALCLHKERAMPRVAS
mmetsp:Transcript_22089/g.48821  ORF Transcript_22089/g.48821 Transcript_22089/m.48821 type:complete len:213 (+) Transcript_22089:422-1060(+)